jgi:hypothetical protein
LQVIESEQEIYQPCFAELVTHVESASLKDFRVTTPVAKGVLRRLHTLLLLHAGFEGFLYFSLWKYARPNVISYKATQPNAFAILDELFAEYTAIIGKSFRTYFDTYSKVASPQVWLLFTLTLYHCSFLIQGNSVQSDAS